MLAVSPGSRFLAQTGACDPFQQAGGRRDPGPILAHCLEAGHSVWKGNTTQIAFTGRVTPRCKLIAG